MAKTLRNILGFMAFFCLCFGFFVPSNSLITAEGEINTKFVMQYGTYVSSYGQNSIYNTSSVFQLTSGPSGRVGYLQFDLTEFLSSDEEINRADLVIHLSQEPTHTGLVLRYATNNIWNDQAPQKDAFNWQDGTRSAINASVVPELDQTYDLTDAKVGELRLEITQIINFVKENYNIEQNGYLVDYVVSFVIYTESGSGSVYFHSHNAEENLRPYIEFNYQSAKPSYDIVLDVGENGAVYSSRELIKEDGVKKYVIEEGEDLTLKVIPDAGYDISSLTVNGEDALTLLEDYQLKLTGIEQNYTIGVVFEVSTATDIIYPLSDITLSPGNTITDESQIRVKTAGSLGNATRVSYLKFDISNFDVEKAALLNLATIPNVSFSSGEVLVTIWGVNFVDWDEEDWQTEQKTWQDMPISSNISLDGSINISNAVKVNETPLSIRSGRAWYTANITEYLRTQKTIGMTSVTLILTGTYTSEPYIVFGSKESIEILDGKICRPYISVLDLDYSVTAVTADNGQTKVLLPDGTETENVREHGSVIIEFTPETGYILKTVSVNGVDMIDKVFDGKLYINNIIQDLEIIPVFAPAKTVSFECPLIVRMYDARFNPIQDSIEVAEGEQLTVYFVLNAGYKMTLLENGLEATGFAKNKITLTVIDDIEFEVQIETIQD
ncbi:MAG: DNRLRE domain-containing protein [Clostridiales bacterium]|nr:DNRLRE domain-containing protein [Clostridiales bacterium]